jgi:hypothetical protein
MAEFELPNPKELEGIRDLVCLKGLFRIVPISFFH